MSDPTHVNVNTRAMKQRLEATITQMRADVRRVDEPQLKALMETSAEVLAGLAKAFGDYERKSDSAWSR